MNPATTDDLARWLIEHMDRIRQHQAAGDMVTEVRAAVQRAVHVIDLPPGRVYAGPCDCGTHLYGHPGRQLVTCPTCGTTWGIPERQEWMRSRLADQLVGAYEASLMLSGIGIYVADGTIRVWASRGKLARRPHPGTDPRYRFGDIVDRALERNTRAGLAA